VVRSACTRPRPRLLTPAPRHPKQPLALPFSPPGASRIPAALVAERAHRAWSATVGLIVRARLSCRWVASSATSVAHCEEAVVLRSILTLPS
jgi:hypothetical protein